MHEGYHKKVLILSKVILLLNSKNLQKGTKTLEKKSFLN